jgi:hypothetical protein
MIMQLYQHEKNILIQLAEHYKKRAEHCKVKATVPGANKKMYLKQADAETEKARVLRKAAG